MGRLHFLFGGVLLFLFGAQLAILDGARWNPLRLVLGYLVFGAAHLSVSYTNDRFDMEADKHNTSSPFSGGSGVLKEHPDLARPGLMIGIALIAISLVLSAVFCAIFGFDPVFLALVVLGNVLGWSYTAPPLRLAYTGLGEVSTALTVGLLVSLFGFYAMAGELTGTFMTAAIPFVLYGIIFILDVQIPDMEGDKAGGKRTAVVSMGRKASFALIAALSLISTAGILLVGISGDHALPFSMKAVSIVTALPLAVSGVASISHDMSQGWSSLMASLIMGSFFLMFGLIDVYLFLRIQGLDWVP
jgi:1,4-dihydroxy-2-naphthoate octaprenyltransferase